MEEQFLELYKKGICDKQIACLLNVKKDKVYSIRKKLNLKPNYEKDKIDADFLKTFNPNKKVKDLIKELNCSESAIYRKLKKFNLKINPKYNTPKIEDIKDEFIREFNNGATQKKLASIFNISNGISFKICKKLGLKRERISDDIYRRYVENGLTDIEIAKKLNKTNPSVTKKRIKLKLKRNLPILKEYVELTEVEFQVMLGGLLGDSTLYRKYNRGDATGSFNHCMKQIEYAKYKQSLLKNITNPIHIVKKYDIRLKTPAYEQAYCYIKSNPALNNMYASFYKESIKVVPRDLFLKINPLGLAIWFMDDGSNANSGYSIATNAFSFDDLLFIKQVLFDKFNLCITIRRSNTIYIKAESVPIFNSLISCYVIPSMQYKLIKRSNHMVIIKPRESGNVLIKENPNPSLTEML